MEKESNKIYLETVQNLFSKENIHYEYHNELALNDLWFNFEKKYKQFIISKSA